MSNELVPTIGNYLSNDKIRKFLESMLKERTGSFITSLISMQNLNKNLQGCEPNSLMMCGLKAVSLGLPLDPNLGHAYPVPYNDRKRNIKECQFQLGYKGYINLAQRTGQYRRLVITDIRAGEIISIDPILEEFKFAPVLDETKRAGLAIVGYYFMFELLNGFRKEFYYSKDKILAHARRYSKSFGEGPWQTNQDEMCRKTMIRLCLPKWGPLSIEMQEALKADQAVLKFDEATESEAIPEYIDSTTTKDLTTDEYTITEAEAEPDKAEEEFKQRKSKAAPDLAEVGK